MTTAQPLTLPVQRPSITAWVLSLLSLVVLLALFGVIDLGKSFLLQHEALERLEESLTGTSTDAVRETLDRMASAREQGNFYGMLRESEEQQAQRDELLMVALNLRAALLSEDRNEIRLAVDELKRGFLSKDSFSARNLGELVNIQRLMQEHLEEYDSVSRAVVDVLGRRKELREELSALTSRYELIESDLNELFSLNLKVRARVGKFSFYTSGVLENLPVLADLKDGLQSLVDLRNELDRIGGKVRIEGDNANQLFTGKLEQIRTVSAEIHARHIVINEQLEAVEAEYAILREDRQQRRQRLLSSINSLILTLSAS